MIAKASSSLELTTSQRGDSGRMNSAAASKRQVSSSALKDDLVTHHHCKTHGMLAASLGCRSIVMQKITVESVGLGSLRKAVLCTPGPELLTGHDVSRPIM